jgi:transposase
VGCGFLDIPQRDPSIQGGGNECVAQRVRSDRLGDPGAAGNPANDPPGTMPVQPPTVRGQEDGAVDPLADGQVDRPGGARCERDGDHLEDLHRLDAKLKAVKAELQTTVQAMGSHLMDIGGICPAGAARILADAGMWPGSPTATTSRPGAGTAPIDASSGQHLRHRLSRAGNRRLNHVPCMAAFARPRRHARPGLLPAQARRREDPDGGHALPAPAPVGAACRQLVTDARAHDAAQAGPGGHPGASVIQRGRPVPGHRHFGSATSRTRTPDATPSQRHRPWPPQPPPHGGAPGVPAWSAPPDKRR